MKEQIGRIILLGTSHVSQESVEEIRKALQEDTPAAVGIELDLQRLRGMLAKKPQKKGVGYMISLMRRVGFFGMVFVVVGGFVQSRIAKKLGVKPGLDMKAAYIESKKAEIPVALIDIPIEQTLKKMSKLSLRVKIGYVLKSLFSVFNRQMQKDVVALEGLVVGKAPSADVTIKAIDFIRKHYPKIYDILIHQRNVYMSNQLLSMLHNTQGNVMAVVGAGHVKGMREYLKKYVDQWEEENVVFSFTVNKQEDL